jgi:hypothetical protein
MHVANVLALWLWRGNEALVTIVCEAFPPFLSPLMGSLIHILYEVLCCAVRTRILHFAPLVVFYVLLAFCITSTLHITSVFFFLIHFSLSLSLSLHL